MVISSLVYVGCENLKDDDNNTVSSNTTYILQHSIKPVGTISGKIIDRHTENPVGGAVVSVGYDGNIVTATTDVSGSFSFANVPCNYDATTKTNTGTYQLTVSLVNVNKTIPDSLPKYREYNVNNTLTVTFIDLAKNDTSKNKVPAEGLEANIRFDIGKMNTTIKGMIVDDSNAPVANATVYLEEFGNSDVLQTTTTDSMGKYTFVKVEGGTTINISARSFDGTLEGQLPGSFSLPINKNSIDLRSQVNIERIVISSADNVLPYVTKITPENLADVSPAGLTIVYKFSEPIKQTAYTNTKIPAGLGTIIDDINFNFVGFKKASGNAIASLDWDSTYTSLTITPTEVVGSAKYSINISAALANMTDRAGKAFAAKAIIGDFETLTFSTFGGSAVPAIPVLVRKVVPNKFDQLNFTGGQVSLQWNYDASARSYNLYRSTNEGHFELIQQNIVGQQTTTNTGSLVNLQNANNPLRAISVRYYVKGVSKDLVEGPVSNIITITDAVKPVLNSVSVVTTSAGNHLFTLKFSEPLTISTAELLTNYIFTNTDTVSLIMVQADYIGFENNAYVVQLYVTSVPSSLPTGYTLTVAASVSDLAGNGMNTTSNSFTTIPPSPVLTLPINNQVGVSTKPTSLSWKPTNGATSYRLQISNSINFFGIVKDTTDIAVNNASFTSLTNNTQYFWRIAAINSAGQGNFSSANTFSTIGVPVLTSPASGSVGQSTTPQLTWTGTAGATSYTVEVATDLAFSNTVVIQKDILATNFTVPNALAGTTLHYWRVTATNNTTGAISVSAVSFFTTL